MRLPSNLFNCIPKEARREFVRSRYELLEKMKQDGTLATTPTNPTHRAPQSKGVSTHRTNIPSTNNQKPAPLPQQYPNKINVAKIGDTDDDQSLGEMSQQEVFGLVAKYHESRGVGFFLVLISWTLTMNQTF